MKYSFPPLVLGASILLASCIKNNDPQLTATYRSITDQRLRDAATVKEGSYFIYQDSATGGIDSFGVTYFAQTTVYNQDDNTNNEVIVYKSYDSVQGPGTIPTIDIGAYRDEVNAAIYLNGQNADGFLMRLPFVVNSTKSDNGIDVTNVQYYASYQVLGNTYNDVYESISKKWSYTATLHSWFSQQSGLIKFTISDSNLHCTYLLKKSFIKK